MNESVNNSKNVRQILQMVKRRYIFKDDVCPDTFSAAENRNYTRHIREIRGGGMGSTSSTTTGLKSKGGEDNRPIVRGYYKIIFVYFPFLIMIFLYIAHCITHSV